MGAVLTQSKGILSQPAHSCSLSILVRRLRYALIERRVDARHVLSKEKNGIHTSGCRVGATRVQKCNPGDLGPCAFAYAPGDFNSRSLSNWRRSLKKSPYLLKDAPEFFVYSKRHSPAHFAV